MDSKINAVIMAGGKGTRLQPLTSEVPKPLVKIIDKPVMECIIELLKKHGITEIAVTLGHMADKIIDYFGNGENFGVNLTYFVENEPLGTAGSVKGCESYLSDTFIVISGDSYTEIDLTNAISFHKAKKSPFTLIATPHNNPVGLGVLDLDHDGRIINFIEKPQTTKPSLINCGIYVIEKRVLNLVPEGFYDFGRQLIPDLVPEIYAFVTYDYWSDIGTLPSYYHTNYLVAMSRNA
ncbi:MAG: nucleotidyltransferase family protein [Firmicutes bacterium]|nr:nucleotidyltransferase family protein [Bacillota bacterium]